MSTVVCAGQRARRSAVAACRHHIAGAALTLGAVVGAAAAVPARRCALGVMIARTRYVARHVDAWRIAPDGPQRRRHAPRAPWCCLGGGGERWAAAAPVPFQRGRRAQQRGEPHGYGEWHGSAPHGETRGHWERGRPVAPFRAIDITTGFTFHAVASCVSTRSEPIDSIGTRARGAAAAAYGASLASSVDGRPLLPTPAARRRARDGRRAALRPSAPRAASGGLRRRRRRRRRPTTPSCCLCTPTARCRRDEADGQLWALGNFLPHLRPLALLADAARVCCCARRRRAPPPPLQRLPPRAPAARARARRSPMGVLGHARPRRAAARCARTATPRAATRA